MKKTIILAGALALVLSTVQMSSGYDAASLDSPFGMHPASMSYSQQDARSFQAAQLMNVGWHRPHVYAFQFLIQKDIKKPQYDFKMHDNLYGKVPVGLKIIANITADIADERSNGYFKKNTYLPVDEEAYIAFVKAVVERYDGDGVDDMPGLTNPIKHWQVDNEPPRKRTGYTKLLELTYNAVKLADPECKVLIGGATGFPNDLVKNFNRVFVPMLKELNGKYFDIFDYHWYGSLKEYAGCKSACQVIRKALDENGFSNAPIWITEIGAYSGKPQRGPGKFDFQSESDQANDIFRKLIHPLSYGVAKIFPAFGMIEGFVDPKDNDYFDNTGLIFDGIGQYDKGRGVKKLSFWTYKLVGKNLGGADLSKVETLTDKDGVTVLKFMVSGKPVYACWFDWWTGNEKTKKVTIKLSNGKWNIYEAIPNKDSGKNVKDTDYPKFFSSTTKTVSNGKLELTLGTKPLIVRQ